MTDVRGVAEPTALHQRADIQGLRAIAVLMVAAYHSGLPLPGGFTGVDVFFVLSGFVITGTLLREWATRGRISIPRFYARRIRRLMPAFALVSVTTVILATLVFSPLDGRQQVTGMAVASASALIANAYFLMTTGGYFQAVAQLNPFLHTWTLSLEEQFYLVFPAVLAGVCWLGGLRSRRWLTAVVLVGCVVSLGAELMLSYAWLPSTPWFRHLALNNDLQRLAFFLPMTRAWEFLAGALVSVAVLGWTPSRGVQNLAASLGVGLLAAAGALLKSTNLFPGVLAAVPVIGTVCLLIAGLGARRSLPTRVLSTRALGWLGDRSYGWYLWHWPAIVFAQVIFGHTTGVACAATVGALIPTALSYRFVEQPIRTRTRWPSGQAIVGIALVCIGVPLSTGLALSSAADHSWGRADLAVLKAETEPNHTDLLNRCASVLPLGAPERPACTWSIPNARGTVLLIGDSNAGHLSEPVIAAAHELGYSVQITTFGSCPLLARLTYATALCRAYVEGSLASIKERSPAYASVIVSNATMGYLGGPMARDFVADAPAGATPNDPQDRNAQIRGWVASMSRTLEAIRARSPVIVVGSIPQFFNFPTCLRPTLLSRPSETCGYLHPSALGFTIRTAVIDAERRAVLDRGGTYMDTGVRLCAPDRGCSAFVDGHVVYRDGAHLSVNGSMLFAPDVRAALVAAAGANGRTR